MQYAPGSPATLSASFTNTQNQLVDPEMVRLNVYDSDGTLVLNNAHPVRVSTGQYGYDLTLPVDADEGLWRAEWQVTHRGQYWSETEYFEVSVDPDTVPVETATHRNLRARIGEKTNLPLEENGSDTLFTTQEIVDLLYLTGNDLDFATLEGWRRKAAYFSAFIDINENGSDRKMSQKWRHANQMVEYWNGVVKEGDKDDNSFRVVGVPIDAYRSRQANGDTLLLKSMQRLYPPYGIHFYPRLIRAF